MPAAPSPSVRTAARPAKAPADLRALVARGLDAAVEYVVATQTPLGSWRVAPGPRLFDTGVVAFALGRLPVTEPIAAALARARRWLAGASPQTHHPLARLLEELPRQLLAGGRAPIDLSDPVFFEPLYRRKALMPYALARLAGCEVLAPIGDDEVRAGLQAFVRAGGETKRWGRADLLAVHVLVEWVAGDQATARAGAIRLEQLQSPAGDFAANPISTAFACLALGLARPQSPALGRCVEHLLDRQQPDGTWRYFETDVWDTSLMVRVFGDHPRFRARCAPAARAFLRRAQRPDGGWGFRSELEADNDSTACGLLCFAGAEQDAVVVERALGFLARTQQPSGLWRTWQSAEDRPAMDCVAHVMEAVEAARAYALDTRRARRWLSEQLAGGGAAPEARWRADWYRSVPYAVLEMTRALGRTVALRAGGQAALRAVRSAEGGWSGEAGAPSSPLDSGLGLAAHLGLGAAVDRTCRRAVEYLAGTQASDGTWPGRPCMVGPRPLLVDMQTNTHAFASWGLMAVAERLGLLSMGAR